MLNQLHTILEQFYSEMVSIRRYLHQHPELSFNETKTAEFIVDYYNNLGIEVKNGVGGNGIVAKLYGKNPGKTIALRADFDALPIQDEKDVPYKSTVPGVMHACGHDGHTATLLILAKALHELKDKLDGTYVFIHQHAEETPPGGAKSMIEDGCLEGVDAIFGTHLWATVPLGTVQYNVGPFMAAADSFEIEIQGQGGHGAQPHKTKDALVAGSQLVIALQQIVSRRVNPLDAAVVTVGTFTSGNAFNAIADTAKITGTIRTFDEEVRTFISQEIENITKGITLANHCSYKYGYLKGYPAVVNHEAEALFLANQAKRVKEIEHIDEISPDMTAEDFAYYLQKVKGTFFFTGAKPTAEKTYGHHHPKFDIDEKAMLIAAKILGTVALTYHKMETNETE